MFFDMPLNSVPCTLNAEEFHRKRHALERTSVADFALWGGLVPAGVGAMAELAECGVIGFKAFMANSGLPEFPRADDLTLYEGMREASRLGLPVAVHAETEELTSQLSRRKIDAGRTSARDYLDSRPVLAEVEAIQRAALMAQETGAKLQIVHVSSGRGVAAALEARAKGVDITIETCAHYLHFTEDDVERIGAAAKCAPPLRSAAERESLWKHVMAGNVDVVASDHSPAPPSMKMGENFFAIWGGIAGVQSTLAVLLEDGYRTRGLALEAIVRLCAEYPARRFRLESKGSLKVGADADLCLVDLKAGYTLGEEHLFQRHKISPYLGTKFRGAVRRTMVRGHTVFADGIPTGSASGRLVRPANTYATSRIHT
jgi:allantoinase